MVLKGRKNEKYQLQQQLNIINKLNISTLLCLCVNKLLYTILGLCSETKVPIHCVSKKFTLLVFTITKSDVDQF